METKTRPRPWACLSGSTLKILAMILMLIDHIGAIVIETGYLAAFNAQLPSAVSYETMVQLMEIDKVLRFIGRSAFPIFCFLLINGFLYTSDKKKYAFRLFLFALISEIPFDMAFSSSILEISYQNVMFTLLIGLLIMMALEHFEKNYIIQAVIIAVGISAGFFLHADYDYRGVIIILALYLFRANKIMQTAAGCVSVLWEAPACLAFIPINLYNNKRGLRIKYLFYFFYPVHIALLVVLRYLLCGV